MSINVRDKFRFLFSDGKGIDATQVRSYLADPPAAGDDVDSWLSHLNQSLPSGYPAPQSLIGSVTGSLTVGQQQAITFSAIGTEASYAILDTSSVGNNPPSSNGNLVILKAGVYRLYGEIAYTGSDRTGPTFQAQRTDGGSLVNLGHTNAYSRDADTELIVDRQLDFYVSSDNARISISVWNRSISASSSGYGTMTMSASNVDNLYILPIGSPS